jgi:hypothetical protein
MLRHMNLLSEKQKPSTPGYKIARAAGSKLFSLFSIPRKDLCFPQFTSDHQKTSVMGGFVTAHEYHLEKRCQEDPISISPQDPIDRPIKPDAHAQAKSFAESQRIDVRQRNAGRR